MFLIFSGSCRHYRREAHGWGPVKQGGLCVHVSLQTVILAAPFSFELSFALRVLHCSLCLFGIHFLIFLDWWADSPPTYLCRGLSWCVCVCETLARFIGPLQKCKHAGVLLAPRQLLSDVASYLNTAWTWLCSAWDVCFWVIVSDFYLSVLEEKGFPKTSLRTR